MEINEKIVTIVYYIQMKESHENMRHLVELISYNVFGEDLKVITPSRIAIGILNLFCCIYEWKSILLNCYFLQKEWLLCVALTSSTKKYQN